jgi:hypothetical protein
LDLVRNKICPSTKIISCIISNSGCSLSASPYVFSVCISKSVRRAFSYHIWVITRNLGFWVGRTSIFVIRFSARHVFFSCSERALHTDCLPSSVFSLSFSNHLYTIAHASSQINGTFCGGVCHHVLIAVPL